MNPCKDPAAEERGLDYLSNRQLADRLVYELRFYGPRGVPWGHLAEECPGLHAVLVEFRHRAWTEAEERAAMGQLSLAPQSYRV